MARLLTSIAAAALLAAAAVSCAGARVGVTPGRPTIAVVIMGSSTAAGTGASAGKAWVERVRSAAAVACPRVTITNLAVGGTVTWQGLPARAGTPPAGRPAPLPAANLDAALALGPALVIVHYPSNDAARAYPLAETVANHGALRDGIRAAGALDLILGPFPRSFASPAQVALMTGLRDALPAVGAPRYLDLWTELAAAENRVAGAYAGGDGIHLGDAGHALIAAKVLASDAWTAVCRP